MRYEISPFHILLALLIVFPILFLNNEDKPLKVAVMTVLFMAYTYGYYRNEANEKNYTVWESIKNDLPTFSKIDMKPWQFLLFLLIAAPFLLFFGSLIVAMFD